jgi:uncharacterized protein
VRGGTEQYYQRAARGRKYHDARTTEVAFPTLVAEITAAERADAAEIVSRGERLHPALGGPMAPRRPFPPFTEETARQKIQAAEDAWNTCDPERVALAYTEDSVWRNRDQFVSGRAEIVEFLRRKWARELDYALRKDLWSFHGNRIAVRFQYECHDDSGNWWRSYGNELWEFTDEGLMRRREASINDLAIDPADRRIHGPRPEAERGATFPLH